MAADKRGVYVPTTRNYELEIIKNVDFNSPEFRELLVRLYQFQTEMALALNLKTSAYYVLDEFVTSNLYFKNPAADPTVRTPQYRNEYRKVINFGALPAMGASLSQPHGISVTSNTRWVGFIGGATNTVGLTGASIPNADIRVTIDNTNITLTASADYSAYTGIITILYLQD